MKKAYIAGPLFDDHEREYLEKITEIVCLLYTSDAADE